MSLTSLPVRIAQVSDLHCGTITFEPELIDAAVRRVNDLGCDLVVVAGDLTASGYEWEFEDAAEWIDKLDAPTFTVMGNHDARNIGTMHFERLFGERFRRERIVFDDERADRLGASGLTVVGVDSSEPDLNEGRIGREWYAWIGESFHEPDDVKVFVLHHHLVSIPGTGRERNTVADAGDVLDVLTELNVDIVLCGHKHVPFFWGLNGTLLCNSGTVSTRRVRGLTPPSFNEIVIDARTIKVYLHYEDGRRELSVVRTRAGRTSVREAFHLTRGFRNSNRVGVGRVDL